MWQAEEAHTDRCALQDLPVHNTIVVQQHYFTNRPLRPRAVKSLSAKFNKLYQAVYTEQC